MLEGGLNFELSHFPDIFNESQLVKFLAISQLSWLIFLTIPSILLIIATYKQLRSYNEFNLECLNK